MLTFHLPILSLGFPPLQNSPSPSLSFSRTNISLQAGIMKSLEESDVGIFCYVSPLPGFRGILKQRYSDFVVNEVDMEGKVVHLTSLDAPDETVEENEKKVTSRLSDDHCAEIESFRALAGDSDANSLKEFIDQMKSDVENGATSFILSPSSDKAHRKAVHNFVKERFKFLVTDTVDGPEPSSKCIRVRLNSGECNDRRRSFNKRKGRDDTPYDSRGSDHWPEDLGKFLRFHLCKENKDTQEALGLIGKMLGIQPRSFGFSGTKDKRSVSTQRVTVFRQRASRLAALNKRLIGIKVGDFCYVNQGLVLGQLHGNQFTIILRGVVADSEETVRAAAESLGKHGFINYFGMQRFGSGSIPTHLIGAKLLRGEWKSAVSMILDPREGEKDAVRRIREYYQESGDVEGTLRQLPRYLVAERAVLQSLKKCPGNYLQALMAIPRTLRMMYVHSYQSYLWNHAASMRVQKYGTEQVVLGDLVHCIEENTPEAKQVHVSECEDIGCNDTSEYDHLEDVAGPAPSEPIPIFVKAINEEDILSGHYTIDDVVLPLPGSRVIYPMNDIEKYYQELAEKDDISLTESVHNAKEFSITSLTGAYRRVFMKVKDFEWELMKYTDINIPLTETDLEIITRTNEAGGKIPNNCNQLKSSEIDMKVPTGCNELEPQGEAVFQETGSLSASTPQEAQLAVKLRFILPASCYATMALRELLKTSTSVAYHKALNQ